MNLRDALLLSLAFGLSGISSGVFAATVLSTVLTPERGPTLLEFDWILIACSIGLGMFGGLTATLFELRAATQKKESINIPLQVASDLCVAAILAVAAFAAVSIAKLPHEYLLGSLPILGVAGQKMLGPVTQGMVLVVTGLFKRLAGKAEG